MSRLDPNLPIAAAYVAPSVSTNNEPVNNQDVQAARRGLWKAMWSASVAPRFSSKPIDMEDYLSNAVRNSFVSENGNSAASPPSPTQEFQNTLVSSSNLTRSERTYLENLLQSDDLESIRRASVRLSDSELFPPAQDPPEEVNHKVLIQHRDSDVQQHLFRLHQETTVKPSIMLKRMSTNEQALRQTRGRDPPEVREDNSITQEGREEDDDGSWNQDSDDEDSPEFSKKSGRKWNPFTDVNTKWIDGSEGAKDMPLGCFNGQNCVGGCPAVS